MSQTVFKPVFDGFMKIYLHDDVPERLASRAGFPDLKVDLSNSYAVVRA